MAAITLDERLARARAGLERLDPPAAAAASRTGAVLIDLRAESQIARDGTIPGAVVIGRNVLEWRLAPDSDRRHPQAPSVEQQVILVCDAGYASSLAAASLQELGFSHATDLDGGFQAWRRAGLPVTPGR
ncbi:MAG: rhodanese-like domain-containing protein [Actinomycetota bacterium]|nr:rhodanese-like domain-containing protein [Actinomycetota bacterium]